MIQGENGERIQLTNEKLIGNGSFGVVFQATMVDTGEIVAVKKVLQDKRFKNRELQIMKQLRHVNIVELKSCFYTNGEKPEEVYLNLLLEFVPETIYRIIRHYSRSARQIPAVLAKLYMYQVARSLAYIHEGGVCHRDIKPQNLLLDPNSHVVKLCDFGSAKMLVPGENNIAYICSRYYRAPELILGCTDYTTAIDTWSYGCVFAELLLSQPLFPGESNVDQLVEIMRIKGTPSKEDMLSMNHHLAEFNFPKVPDHTWQKVFRNRAAPDCIDLISKLVTYNPTRRLTPMQACAHPYYDELRNPSTVLPDGRGLPTHILFNFTPEEIRAAGDLYHKLNPIQQEYLDRSQPSLSLEKINLDAPSSASGYLHDSGPLPPASAPSQPLSAGSLVQAPSTSSNLRVPTPPNSGIQRYQPQPSGYLPPMRPDDRDLPLSAHWQPSDNGLPAHDLREPGNSRQA